VTEEFPDDATDLLEAQPVYETVPGWRAASSGVTSFEKLPEAAKTYVARLEELLGAPAALISTGPRREETIVRAIAPLTGWLPGLVKPRAGKRRPGRS
jgi:adenylosuccinate synthase